MHNTNSTVVFLLKTKQDVLIICQRLALLLGIVRCC